MMKSQNKNNDIFSDDLFKDHHVLVTGGSSGIGFDTAKRFASKGAKISILARDQEKLENAKDEIIDTYSVDCMGLSSDVRDYERLSQVIRESFDQFGPIDVLVCAAAGNFVAPAADMSSNAFESVVDIDLIGTFNACKASYDYFGKSSTSIVAISAVHSDQPVPFQSHACAAKAGIDSLVQTLAAEWADDNIRVNAIQPGPVEETEGIERLTPDEESKKELENVLPANRLAEKKEISNLVLYLSTTIANYITGAIIPIDGGQSLIGPGKVVDSLMK